LGGKVKVSGWNCMPIMQPSNIEVSHVTANTLSTIHYYYTWHNQCWLQLSFRRSDSESQRPP